MSKIFIVIGIVFVVMAGISRFIYPVALGLHAIKPSSFLIATNTALLLAILFKK
ncbi:MAG: hypothetical protein KKH94_02735 [Candidatus Omnitrophica bacterium]|nr:hypothetical protein [Candidatus Omnitrophota bacterium]